MQSLLAILVLGFLVWRVIGFMAAYRRARMQKVLDEAEREQKKDWARRMQGRSEQGK